MSRYLWSQTNQKGVFANLAKSGGTGLPEVVRLVQPLCFPIRLILWSSQVLYATNNIDKGHHDRLLFALRQAGSIPVQYSDDPAPSLRQYGEAGGYPGWDYRKRLVESIEAVRTPFLKSVEAQLKESNRAEGNSVGRAATLPVVRAGGSSVQRMVRELERSGVISWRKDGMVYHRCPHNDGHGPFLKPCVTYYPKPRGSGHKQQQQQGGAAAVTETVMDWEPTFLLHPETNYMYRSWANMDHRLLMVKYTPANESAVAAALSQDDAHRDSDGVAFLGRQYKIIAHKPDNQCFILFAVNTQCPGGDPSFPYCQTQVVHLLLGASNTETIPGKVLARRELMLSPTITLPHDVQLFYVNDIPGRGEGKVMTDGNGLMAMNMAVGCPKVASGVVLPEEHQNKFGATLNVFQVRFMDGRMFPAGIGKGTLTPCAALPNNVAVVPWSMLKLPAKPQNLVGSLFIPDEAMTSMMRRINPAIGTVYMVNTQQLDLVTAMIDSQPDLQAVITHDDDDTESVVVGPAHKTRNSSSSSQGHISNGKSTARRGGKQQQAAPVDNDDMKLDEDADDDEDAAQLDRQLCKVYKELSNDKKEVIGFEEVLTMLRTQPLVRSALGKVRIFLNTNLFKKGTPRLIAELVQILAAGGLPESEFARMMQDHVDKMCEVGKDFKLTVQTFRDHGFEAAAERLEAGFGSVPGGEVHDDRRVLDNVELRLAYDLQYLSRKVFESQLELKIPFQEHEAMRVIVVPDWTGSVPENCAVLLGKIQVYGQTEVLLYRNPGLHGMDVRKISLVPPTQQLMQFFAIGPHHDTKLDDVLICSAIGWQSILDESSGGDYDGDDVELIFKPSWVKWFQPMQQQQPQQHTTTTATADPQPTTPPTTSARKRKESGSQEFRDEYAKRQELDQSVQPNNLHRPATIHEIDVDAQTGDPVGHLIRDTQGVTNGLPDWTTTTQVDKNVAGMQLQQQAQGIHHDQGDGGRYGYHNSGSKPPSPARHDHRARPSGHNMVTTAEVSHAHRTGCDDDDEDYPTASQVDDMIAQHTEGKRKAEQHSRCGQEGMSPDKKPRRDSGVMSMNGSCVATQHHCGYDVDQQGAGRAVHGDRGLAMSLPMPSVTPLCTSPIPEGLAAMPLSAPAMQGPTASPPPLNEQDQGVVKGRWQQQQQPYTGEYQTQSHPQQQQGWYDSCSPAVPNFNCTMQDSSGRNLSPHILRGHQQHQQQHQQPGAYLGSKSRPASCPPGHAHHAHNGHDSAKQPSSYPAAGAGAQATPSELSLDISDYVEWGFEAAAAADHHFHHRSMPDPRYGQQQGDLGNQATVNGRQPPDIDHDTDRQQDMYDDPPVSPRAALTFASSSDDDQPLTQRAAARKKLARHAAGKSNRKGGKKKGRQQSTDDDEDNDDDEHEGHRKNKKGSQAKGKVVSKSRRKSDPVEPKGKKQIALKHVAGGKQGRNSQPQSHARAGSQSRGKASQRQDTDSESECDQEAEVRQQPAATTRQSRRQPGPGVDDVAQHNGCHSRQLNVPLDVPKHHARAVSAGPEYNDVHQHATYTQTHGQVYQSDACEFSGRKWHAGQSASAQPGMTAHTCGSGQGYTQQPYTQNMTAHPCWDRQGDTTHHTQLQHGHGHGPGYMPSSTPRHARYPPQQAAQQQGHPGINTTRTATTATMRDGANTGNVFMHHLGRSGGAAADEAAHAVQQQQQVVCLDEAALTGLMKKLFQKGVSRDELSKFIKTGGSSNAIIGAAHLMWRRVADLRGARHADALALADLHALALDAAKSGKPVTKADLMKHWNVEDVPHGQFLHVRHAFMGAKTPKAAGGGKGKAQHEDGALVQERPPQAYELQELYCYIPSGAGPDAGVQTRLAKMAPWPKNAAYFYYLNTPQRQSNAQSGDSDLPFAMDTQLEGVMQKFLGDAGISKNKTLAELMKHCSLAISTRVDRYRLCIKPTVGDDQPDTKFGKRTKAAAYDELVGVVDEYVAEPTNLFIYQGNRNDQSKLQEHRLRALVLYCEIMQRAHVQHRRKLDMQRAMLSQHNRMQNHMTQQNYLNSDVMSTVAEAARRLTQHAQHDRWQSGGAGGTQARGPTPQATPQSTPVKGSQAQQGYGGGSLSAPASPTAGALLTYRAPHTRSKSLTAPKTGHAFQFIHGPQNTPHTGYPGNQNTVVVGPASRRQSTAGAATTQRQQQYGSQANTPGQALGQGQMNHMFDILDNLFDEEDEEDEDPLQQMMVQGSMWYGNAGLMAGPGDAVVATQQRGRQQQQQAQEMWPTKAPGMFYMLDTHIMRMINAMKAHEFHQGRGTLIFEPQCMVRRR